MRAKRERDANIGCCTLPAPLCVFAFCLFLSPALCSSVYFDRLSHWSEKGIPHNITWGRQEGGLARGKGCLLKQNRSPRCSRLLLRRPALRLGHQPRPEGTRSRIDFTFCRPPAYTPTREPFANNNMGVTHIPVCANALCYGFFDPLS